MKSSDIITRIVTCCSACEKEVSSAGIVYLAHLSQRKLAILDYFIKQKTPVSFSTLPPQVANSDLKMIFDYVYTLVFIDDIDRFDPWRIAAAIRRNYQLSTFFGVSSTVGYFPVLANGVETYLSIEELDDYESIIVFGYDIADKTIPTTIPTIDGEFCNYRKEVTLGKNKHSIALDALNLMYEVIDIPNIDTFNLLAVDVGTRLHHPHMISYDDIIIHGTCNKVTSMALVSDVFLPPAELNFSEIIKCMYQIGTAIDCLNRNGIFHKHVKPENIGVKNGHYVLSGLTGVDHTGNDVKAYAETFKDFLLSVDLTKEQEKEIDKVLTPCLNIYEELRPTMAMILINPIFDQVRTFPIYEPYYPIHTTSPSPLAIEAMLKLCDQYPEQPAAVAFAAIELLYTCWDELPGDLIPVLYWVSVALCGVEIDIRDFCYNNEIEEDMLISQQEDVILFCKHGMLTSKWYHHATCGSDIVYIWRDVFTHLPEDPASYWSTDIKLYINNLTKRTKNGSKSKLLTLEEVYSS